MANIEIAAMTGRQVVLNSDVIEQFRTGLHGGSTIFMGLLSLQVRSPADPLSGTLGRPRTGRGLMKLPRRQFLHLAAGAAVLPAVSRIARAQVVG